MRIDNLLRCKGLERKDKKQKRQGRRQFTLLIQRDGSSDIKRHTLTDGRLTVLIGAGLALLVFIMAIGVVSISEWRFHQRTGQLIAENRLLGHQLSEIQKHVLSVQSLVDSIATEEELLRTKVDLPVISEDVRMAGVGSMMPLENQVIGDQRVEDLLLALDQIDRELSIQQQSFNEIQKKIISDEERMSHIPAIKPVNTGRFTDGYGYRKDPFTGKRRFHYGADFAAPRGTPVYATADGKVVKVKKMGGFGKTIEVDHGYGYRTVYGHLHDYKVKRGQSVKRGDIIGLVGSTGRSTGPHLHYEVQVEKRAVNPLDYFYEGYELARGKKQL